jgi:hypothetical protein
MPRPYPQSSVNARSRVCKKAGASNRRDKISESTTPHHILGCGKTISMTDVDLGKAPMNLLSFEQRMPGSVSSSKRLRFSVEHQPGLNGGNGLTQKGAPGIDRLVETGASVKTRCRRLGVSTQDYYSYRKRPTSSAELRRRGRIQAVSATGASRSRRLVTRRLVASGADR